MDVGSSPMVEITSCDVIINKLYTKSQLSIILMSRPFGTTRCCSSLHDHIYKVPAHYCIMTRHLGATYVEYSVLTKMNNMNFFKVVIFTSQQFCSPASTSFNRRITRWTLSPICLLSRRLGSWLKWIILHNFFCEKPTSANWVWS